MKNQNTKIVSVQLPQEVYEKIEELANKNYTSNSTILRQIIIEHFNRIDSNV